MHTTPEHIARYPLTAGGTVRHWLANGPAATLLDDLDRVVSPTGSPFGARGRWTLSYWAYHPDVIALKDRVFAQLALNWQPHGRPTLQATGPAGQPWRYAAADADRTVDFSRFSFAPALLEAWAYAALHVENPQTVRAAVTAIGPVRVWLNGAQVPQQGDAFSYVAPRVIPVTLALHAGHNDLYLHGVMLGWREARLGLGLHLPDAPPVTVGLPLGDIPAQQWQQAQAGLDHLRVRQFAFPELPAAITLDASAPNSFTLEAEARIQLTPRVPPLDDLPFEHARLTLAPGETGTLPVTPALAATMAQLPEENTLLVTLRPADGTPIERAIPIWTSAKTYRHTPYGDYEQRRREAREHLAQLRGSVLGAAAAVATGRAQHIDSAPVALACSFLESRYDCADFFAIELLALLGWYGDDPALRPADRQRIEDAFRGFKFWLDEPGLDGMCYITENHQILFHVTAYLAGQRWPEHRFDNSGLTGHQQHARARRRIENWTRRRLAGGFSEWDSNSYLTMDAFALLALVEFAQSARLREMASALLHKLFFMIACQSFRGAHGSTHGRCYVEGLKSARVENTQNLQRIAWGMGIFNGEARATGLLAFAQRYRVPDVIQHIGAHLPPELVTQARSRGTFRPQFDLHRGEWDVHTITRRTPDGMLAAAIDQRPGAWGVQEHLWQATLGPEAVVFTTYPGNSQQHGSARPNYWAGSARLPRVALHHRTVICLYRVEPDVGSGFTHAYFPVAAFDETHIAGHWAFARKGNGYVALWGDGPLQLTAHGPHTDQELRSTGAGQVWIAHMGSAAEDGAFTAFQARVQAHVPDPAQNGTDAPRVTWTTPDGDRLAFAWQGSLSVNDAPVQWDDIPHYHNAYTHTPPGAATMTIAHEGQRLVLDLQRGKVLEE